MHEAYESAIVVQAENGDRAIKLALEGEWDLVTLSNQLAGRSGLEVLKEVKRARPQLPILMLSLYDSLDYIRVAFQLGASGYVSKSGAPADILAGIDSLLAGEPYLCPILAAKYGLDAATGFTGRASPN